MSGEGSTAYVFSPPLPFTKALSAAERARLEAAGPLVSRVCMRDSTDACEGLPAHIAAKAAVADPAQKVFVLPLAVVDIDVGRARGDEDFAAREHLLDFSRQQLLPHAGRSVHAILTEYGASDPLLSDVLMALDNLFSRLVRIIMTHGLTHTNISEGNVCLRLDDGKWVARFVDVGHLQFVDDTTFPQMDQENMPAQFEAAASFSFRRCLYSAYGESTLTVEDAALRAAFNGAADRLVSMLTAPRPEDPTWVGARRLTAVISAFRLFKELVQLVVDRMPVAMAPFDEITVPTAGSGSMETLAEELVVSFSRSISTMVGSIIRSARAEERTDGAAAGGAGARVGTKRARAAASGGASGPSSTKRRRGSATEEDGGDGLAGGATKATRAHPPRRRSRSRRR